MADEKLIAILPGGRAFTVQIDAQMTPEQALAELTGRSGGGVQPSPWSRWPWLDTEERFRIRRDAVIAYVIGHKDGDWAVAGSS